MKKLMVHLLVFSFVIQHTSISLAQNGESDAEVMILENCFQNFFTSTENNLTKQYGVTVHLDEEQKTGFLKEIYEFTPMLFGHTDGWKTTVALVYFGVMFLSGLSRDQMEKNTELGQKMSKEMKKREVQRIQSFAKGSHRRAETMLRAIKSVGAEGNSHFMKKYLSVREDAIRASKVKSAKDIEEYNRFISEKYKGVVKVRKYSFSIIFMFVEGLLMWNDYQKNRELAQKTNQLSQSDIQQADNLSEIYDFLGQSTDEVKARRGALLNFCAQMNEMELSLLFHSVSNVTDKDFVEFDQWFDELNQYSISSFSIQK